MKIVKELEEIGMIKEHLNSCINQVLDVYEPSECNEILKNLVNLQKEADDLEKQFVEFL